MEKVAVKEAPTPRIVKLGDEFPLFPQDNFIAHSFRNFEDDPKIGACTLIILRTDELPDLPFLIFAAGGGKRHPLSINPSGKKGYSITTADLDSAESRVGKHSQVLSETQPTTDADDEALAISVAGPVKSKLDEQVIMKLFLNDSEFRPKIMERLKKIRLEINCGGRIFQGEPFISHHAILFEVFHPVDTPPLPTSPQTIISEVNGNPIQFSNVSDLANVQAKFVLAEDQPERPPFQRPVEK